MSKRIMFCAKHLKFYKKDKESRDYSVHSTVLNDKLKALRVNMEYRDSLS